MTRAAITSRSLIIATVAAAGLAGATMTQARPQAHCDSAATIRRAPWL